MVSLVGEDEGTSDSLDEVSLEGTSEVEVESEVGLEEGASEVVELEVEGAGFEVVELAGAAELEVVEVATGAAELEVVELAGAAELLVVDDEVVDELVVEELVLAAELEVVELAGAAELVVDELVLAAELEVVELAGAAELVVELVLAEVVLALVEGAAEVLALVEAGAAEEEVRALVVWGEEVVLEEAVLLQLGLGKEPSKGFHLQGEQTPFLEAA